MLPSVQLLKIVVKVMIIRVFIGQGKVEVLFDQLPCSVIGLDRMLDVFKAIYLFDGADEDIENRFLIEAIILNG